MIYPLWITSWWFQPIWKILVKLDIFPNFRGENKKCLSCHHLDQVYFGNEYVTVQSRKTNQIGTSGRVVGLGLGFFSKSNGDDLAVSERDTKKVRIFFYSTLQGINISHLGKRKIIFKYAIFGGYVNFLEGKWNVNRNLRWTRLLVILRILGFQLAPGASSLATIIAPPISQGKWGTLTIQKEVIFWTLNFKISSKSS